VNDADWRLAAPDPPRCARSAKASAWRGNRVHRRDVDRHHAIAERGVAVGGRAIERRDAIDRQVDDRASGIAIEQRVGVGDVRAGAGQHDDRDPGDREAALGELWGHAIEARRMLSGRDRTVRSAPFLLSAMRSAAAGGSARLRGLVRGLQQVRADQIVEVAVENALDVAGLDLGPVSRRTLRPARPRLAPRFARAT
jgi:hypothetical protein